MFKKKISKRRASFLIVLGMFLCFSSFFTYISLRSLRNFSNIVRTLAPEGFEEDESDMLQISKLVNGSGFG